MIDFEPILKANPAGVFATHDGGKIKTRVFQFLFAEGKKVYFCTSSEKQVYAQIVANPQVGFCTHTPDFAPVLSLNGKAVFVEDKSVKERVLRENPGIKQIYGNTDNPLLKIFYIDIEEMESFSTETGLKNFKF